MDRTALANRQQDLQEENAKSAKDAGIDRFQINVAKRIRWKDLPNFGAFAIVPWWPHDPERGKVLCADLPALKRECRVLKRQGAADVWIFTAKKTAIADPGYQARKEAALRWVEEARRAEDREGLRFLRRKTESRGVKPGPKPNPETYRKLIEQLKAIAEGALLKQTVPKANWARSSSAQLSRFCADVHFWCGLFCRRPGLYCPHEDDLRDPHIQDILQEKLGFSLPGDFSAALAALRRHPRFRS
jgi:hypothetical protein